MFLDLLKQELGESKDAVNETRFCCPFCNETKYRFYVHTDKGVWICFKCEEKGNPLTFVTNYYNATPSEAIDILATYDYDVKSERDTNLSTAHYGSDLTEEERLMLFISRKGEPLEDDSIAKKYVCPSPPSNSKTLMANFDNPEAFPFFGYLNSRGVTLEHIKQHNISYVINGEVELADGRKLTLINHLIFYTFDNNRKPIYWNTRSIDPSPFIKSFNAPSRENEYSKNNTVFNLNNARHADKIVIHEGVFDSLMTPGCGVAAFGKMVTDEQVNIILAATQEKKQPIYLYLDTDAWKQMIASANKIKSTEPGRQVYYVYSGQDDDANKLGLEKVQMLIDEAFLADSQGEMKLRMMNM